jgi:hypothetical protein
MTLINKLALFLCISAFSGSMVLMGARDLRAALQEPTSDDLERAKRLIQQLRGDELFRVQAKYHETSEKPPRKPGSVLPEYDLAKIKKLLVNMIGGAGDGASEDVDKN